MTAFTFRGGAYSGRSGEPITSSSMSASALSDVSTPVPTLNTASVAGDAAASTLARATSSTCTKSIVSAPSPKIFGGRPASIASIHRISTSVYAPNTSMRGP